MLSSKLRFHRRNAVNYVQRKGKSVRKGQFLLKYVANNRDGSRLGVVVSKKVDKRATVRNRIRRRVYEVMRNNWKDLDQGHDILIMVFDASVAETDSKEINDTLIDLLKKAQLFKG